jgi:hypothetical protein
VIGELLVKNIWFTLSLWGCIYLSDYFLTIWAARLYRTGAREHLILEGSLEITPYFQEDVDAQKPLSMRFLRALAFSIFSISLAWILSVEWAGLPQAFAILIGALVFLEATAHIRHIRNIVLLRNLRKSRTLTGRIEYPRWLSLRISSVEILGFAVLFFVAFLLSGSWFFVGGVASCLITGLKHMEWSDRARKNAQGRPASAVRERATDRMESPAPSRRGHQAG